MPYKSPEQETQASKERMRRYREKQKGVTEQGVTTEGVTEMVEASYVEGLHGRQYQFLPERPRYLTLSDGQVLDRRWKPDQSLPSGTRIQALRASNEACLNYHPNQGVLPDRIKAKLVKVT